jgi:hypothetical protein
MQPDEQLFIAVPAEPFVEPAHQTDVYDGGLSEIRRPLVER